MTSPTRVARALLRDQRGAMAVVTVVFALFLVAMLYYLFGVGQALLYRERMQDAADAAAHGAAVMHARGMNLVALINVIMAALLAVLVALKLVSTLVTISIGALFAASFFNPAALVPVPALNELRSAVDTAHEAANSVVQPSVAVLHTTAMVAAAATPIAAAGLASATVTTHYAPSAQLGFAMPPAVRLPLQSSSYAKLCRKSAGFVADFTLHPLRQALGAPGKVVLGVVKDAVEEMAEGAPAWFCDGAAAKLTVKTKQAWPRSESQQACVAGVGAVHAVTSACKAAAQETELAMPDPISGECTGLCQRDLYLAQAERARVECDPNKHEHRRDYVSQVRTTLFTQVGRGGSARWEVEHTEVALLKTKSAPCPLRGLDGFQWHRKMFDDDGHQVAVCTLQSEPRDDGSVELIDITNVFGCAQAVTEEPKLGDVGGDVPEAKSGDQKAPMELADGVALGGDAFQVRAAVIGQPGGDVARRLVRLASFGKQVNEPELPGQSVSHRLALAQAEFYFDADGAEPDAALWEQKWKARLRRFRASERDATAAAQPSAGSAVPVTFESACRLAGAAFKELGPVCSALSNDVLEMRRWLAH